MQLQLTRLEKRFDLDKYIAGFEHRMVGDEAVMDCPNCVDQGKSEKLWIRMKDKRDTDGEIVPRGTWICYYCRDDDAGGAGRTCLSLIEWLEDLEFLDAVKRLADGGTAADADFVTAIEKLMKTLDDEGEVDDEPPPTIELPRGFVRITEKHYPAYCAERGISVTRAMRFGLGFVPPGKGYCENRLIAPVMFEGRCVGFQARYMKRKPPMCEKTELPCAECGGKREHKRIRKTKHAAKAKMSRVLYNWDDARTAQRLVLVESPWATIKIGRSGAGTFGKHLSSRQLELVMKSDAEEIVIAWDLDKDHAKGKGGYDQALALGERLSSLVPVRVLKLKRDIDEMSLSDLRTLIARTKVMSATDVWAARIERRLSWM